MSIENNESCWCHLLGGKHQHSSQTQRILLFSLIICRVCQQQLLTFYCWYDKGFFFLCLIMREFKYLFLDVIAIHNMGQWWCCYCFCFAWSHKNNADGRIRRREKRMINQREEEEAEEKAMLLQKQKSILIYFSCCFILFLLIISSSSSYLFSSSVSFAEYIR